MIYDAKVHNNHKIMTLNMIATFFNLSTSTKQRQVIHFWSTFLVNIFVLSYYGRTMSKTQKHET